MAVTNQNAESLWRWKLTLRSAETFADDLAFVGEKIGPRSGPNKRLPGDKEDWTLRRVLFALVKSGSLALPVDIRAAGGKAENEAGRRNERIPDFILTSSADGSEWGLEVTEAGERKYQEWLTQSERADDDVVMLPGEGFVGDKPETAAVADIHRAIAEKTAKDSEKPYRVKGPCDLVIYDNGRTGWLTKRREVVRLLKNHGAPRGLRFRKVHLILDGTVILDVFGNDTREVSIRGTYETDFAGWAAEQATRLRSGEDIDRINLAEEVESLGRSDQRALASHLRNLMHHLLKWRYQPNKRTDSWLNSIETARGEIFDLVTESPSLGRLVATLRDRKYPEAVRDAARETGLPRSTFPDVCEFDLEEEVLNDDFLPEGATE